MSSRLFFLFRTGKGPIERRSPLLPHVADYAKRDPLSFSFFWLQLYARRRLCFFSFFIPRSERQRKGPFLPPLFRTIGKENHPSFLFSLCKKKDHRPFLPSLSTAAKRGRENKLLLLVRRKAPSPLRKHDGRRGVTSELLLPPRRRAEGLSPLGPRVFFIPK